MDRIRAFNNSWNTGELAANANANEITLPVIEKLDRKTSNTSTDSMDIQIMEEIKDIFLKEIQPKNALFPTLAIRNNENVPKQILPVAAVAKETNPILFERDPHEIYATEPQLKDDVKEATANEAESNKTEKRLLLKLIK
jgi:hypothetical protein